jgi:GTPase
LSENQELQRCGFSALIGPTNAGKSTLLNGLIGAKIAIVTHKVQTTRARLRGICIEGDTQIIFVDTPGIFKPKRKLDEAMVEAAWSGAGDADVIVLVIDANRGIEEDVETIFKQLAKQSHKCILALNKIDLLPREKLLKLAQDCNQQFPFEATFMISALNGDGLDDLRSQLAGMMPINPWHYPDDQIADVTERQMAAEITREKVFLRLHQELPYASTVETARWKKLRDGSIRIEQVIFVERKSQRVIVLGEKGRTIKKIGELARAEIQESLGIKAHLFLFVKVRDKWTQDPERYFEMGLNFPGKKKK